MEYSALMRSVGPQSVMWAAANLSMSSVLQKIGERRKRALVGQVPWEVVL